MKKEDAPFIHSDRDFAACSHWADCMKMVHSSIFYRSTNVKKNRTKGKGA